MNLFSGLEKFGIKATDSTDLYADEKAAEKKTKEKVETPSKSYRKEQKHMKDFWKEPEEKKINKKKIIISIIIIILIAR